MFAQFSKEPKIFLFATLMLLLSAEAGFAQGTAFTFQGKLGDSGSPVNGTFEMQFKLLSEPTCDPTVTTGCQIGTTITLNSPLVQVTNGVFTVQLDFGAAALPGADRFLEIGIRRNNTDPYTRLSPRSKITSSPYAIRSRNATDADSLSSACVGCIQDSQVNTLDASKLTGTIPASTISAGSLPAGSGNYIQNTTSPQSGSFNITGNGAVNSLKVSGNELFGNLSLDVRGNSFFRGSSDGIDTSQPVLHVLGSQPIGFDFGFVAAADVLKVIGGKGASTVFSNVGSGGKGADALIQAGDGGNGNFGGNGGSITLQAGFAGGGSKKDGVGGSINLRADGTQGSVNLRADNSGSINLRASGVTALVAKDGIVVNVPSSASPISPLTLEVQSFQTSSNAIASYYFKARNIGSGAPSAFVIRGDGNIGVGTDTPGQKLHVAGNGFFTGNLGVGTNAPVEKLHVSGGFARLDVLGGGGTTNLCRNGGNQISFCSSSLRYKENVNDFISGLTLIKRLSPITFDWKQGGMKDVGFGAEDVAQVNPLFVTYNEKGEVDGVKYDRLSVAFVNAFKEQQAQIERQQREIDALKRLVCVKHVAAEICKTKNQ